MHATYLITNLSNKLYSKSKLKAYNTWAVQKGDGVMPFPKSEICFHWPPKCNFWWVWVNILDAKLVIICCFLSKTAYLSIWPTKFFFSDQHLSETSAPQSGDARTAPVTTNPQQISPVEFVRMRAPTAGDICLMCVCMYVSWGRALSAQCAFSLLTLGLVLYL